MSVRKLSTLVAVAFLSASVPAQTPSPRDSTATADAAARQKELLDSVRDRIKGRENEPAEKVFGNIELLRGKPASRLPGMMTALTGLLGVTCTTCHVPGRFESARRGSTSRCRPLSIGSISAAPTPFPAGRVIGARRSRPSSEKKVNSRQSKVDNQETERLLQGQDDREAAAV
jgi:hypothetical protein